jgi:hypothetical protein
VKKAGREICPLLLASELLLSAKKISPAEAKLMADWCDREAD